MKFLKYITISILAGALLTSCGDDFFDTEYTAYLDSDTAAELAAKDPDALIGYLNGAWSFMVSWNVSGADAHDDFSFMSVLHSTDMMSEDMTMFAFHWFGYDYDFDNRMFNYRRTRVDWSTFYTAISKANELISFFPEEPTSADSKGVLGQALAIRGLSYYYLIQLYQFTVTESGAINTGAPGVPLVYSSADGLTEDEETKKLGRNTVGEVFAQIEDDLTRAVDYLEAGYSRPSKMFIDAAVANGILARYYLLSQQWDKAASAAAKAHSGYSIMGQSGLHDGFMALSNTEWMWGYDHNTESQTTFASFFSHVSNLAPGYSGMAYSGRGIDKRLYDQIPDTDFRKALFNGPDGDDSQPTPGAKYPYAILKFGSTGDWTMDYMYMRAAEMVLIEAEALAHQNKNTEAATALKKLMEKRDPAWSQTSVTVEDVYLQRRIELIGEGFSYFDLKRLNKGIDRNYDGSNHLTGYKKTIAAQDKVWLYQIPNQEMQENSQISDDDQNP